ncbi:AEC family transporter [Campylobacter geochelonis]|uniref:Auxin efflux carrier n=1 Tax=Campylobacter geochelonis TaxID=1780362 RepID=A0A128EDX1_9BACT|nr:AEC family transporter [Campylobacter geochelonis]QKF71912.1 putative permease [Campylobacter geochelonis]CZE47136.1 auxin efflux carrier [Campylobacter geochelonis]CZE47886.1 auxin efflux carrier [Campylobacter geochelonis]CZE51024.1 auxin efflux carrier [Campylobacter geochelonis]
MAGFLALFNSIVPLYLCILLGLFSTAVLKCDRETVAKILLFILSPLVVFNSAMSVEFSFAIFAIPIFSYIMGVVISLSCLPFFRRIFRDNTANLLAFSVGSGNSANLGIPIALLLLSDELVEIFIFSTIGAVMYQNTVGYYITAKESYGIKQTLIKVALLPVLYALLLGLALNYFGVKMPPNLAEVFVYVKGTLAFLGMMMVGMGLENIRAERGFDTKFIALASFVKFIIWPVLTLIFIVLDVKFFHIFTQDLYIILYILAIVPLAGNCVTIAALLGVQPAKMSMAVFVTTVISLFSIPLMLYLYRGFEGVLFKF